MGTKSNKMKDTINRNVEYFLSKCSLNSDKNIVMHIDNIEKHT